MCGALDMWVMFLFLCVQAALCQLLGILAIFRNEARIMHEWVAHHHLEGVSQFVLINDNSTDNGPHIARSLNCTVIDNVRHWLWPMNICQTSAYRKFQHLLQTQWMMIIDLDEFVYARAPYRRIVDYLAALDSDVGAVVLPWKIFGSAGERHPRSVIEGCPWRGSTTASGFPSNVKTVVRQSSLQKIQGPHICKVHGLTIDSGGRIYEHPPFYFQPVPNMSHALHINHYPLQSWEFYSAVKMTRGEATGHSYGARDKNRRDVAYYKEYHRRNSEVRDEELLHKRGRNFFKSVQDRGRTMQDSRLQVDSNG